LESPFIETVFSLNPNPSAAYYQMRVSTHIYTSAVAATALYAYSHSIWEAAICFASGILIDLDHTIDFYLFSREKFSVDDFFSWFYENRWQKIVLVFHSYELFGFVYAAAYYLDSEVLRAVLWGTSVHLLLDQVGNNKTYQLSPWFYFMGYRIAVRFRREKLLNSF
jgi:hypothetical protein